MACLRGWRASVGDVGGVLAWVACLCGSRASVGGVSDVHALVACQLGWRLIIVAVITEILS